MFIKTPTLQPAEPYFMSSLMRQQASVLKVHRHNRERHLSVSHPLHLDDHGSEPRCVLE